MRVLLVEDDLMIGDAVRDHLVASSYAVDWVRMLSDGSTALEAVNYGLVLLDLQLPDGSGIELLKRLRRQGNATPVIVITARDQISDRIEGLNSGADDYLVKPFDLGELEARMMAVSRRHDSVPHPVIRFADIEIDRPEHKLTVADEQVVLTSREWAILDLLVARVGSIVPKDRIEEALYAFGSEIESNTVEVYISRLRKKIGKDRITTVRGVGYSLEDK
ncbi:response regulator transcription factor [Rhizobium sp. BK251]|uniref:response regulator n=1 Tax=Rhizobium sp. BK251 TaxID=2512125 RepID=UPI0010478703|nr:response regulator transcription factor [Rhizobium sp. BK251]TCL75759.1 two-component system OmpR family response regulator [Rhizobium sp. BK251]